MIYALAAMALCGCGRASDGCTETDLNASREAGRRDAAVAVAADSASHERDGAVMSIRARETRLREAGYYVAADAYVDGAAEVLRSNGLIE